MKRQKQRHPINRAGIWLIVFSLPYLIVAIFGFAGYIILNQQLFEVNEMIGDLPSEIIDMIGDIDIFSTVFSTIGMIMLFIAIVSIFIWFLMILIGIINLRRNA